MAYRFTFELTLYLSEKDAIHLSEDDYTRIPPPADDCAICLERGGDWVRIQCNHAFHLHCIRRVASKKCPLCRKPIQAESTECSIL